MGRAHRERAASVSTLCRRPRGRRTLVEPMDLTTLQPVFVGFFPKLVEKRPEWLTCNDVAEVCSVSTCVSAGPPNWINHWRHNRAGFFDTVERALSVIEEGARPRYRVLAFREWPLRLRERRDRHGLGPDPAPVAGVRRTGLGGMDLEGPRSGGAREQ